MKLFEVLPDNYFQLLTGPNKHMYAEAVLFLYEQSQLERFGIRYDVLRDLLQEMIESYKEKGIDFSPEEEEGDPAVTGEATEWQSGQLKVEEISRAQANALIRRLAKLRWIDVEVRDQYEQYIVLPHYTSRILALFKELCDNRTVEYQRFAFVTYQLLTGEEAKRRPSFAVREAAQVTIQFQQELITLYNNMKHHMEQVVQKMSIQDVLDHHFDVYKKQIVDLSYHRLKTSDHVSRYRFQILQTVQKWLLDRDLMEETIEDGIRNEFYADRQEAEADIRTALYRIEEIYNGLDEIFYQIDLRHNQYLRSSYDRARYLSQQTQGLDQMLADILEHFSRIRNRIPEDSFPWPQLFHLQRVNTLTENSLLPPRSKRPLHQPEKHIVVPVSDELKAALREQSKERIRKAVTRKKVEQYVLARMGERAQIELAELAPQNPEEFLMLTFVYLYGQDGMSAFRLKRSEERSILLVGPYRFHNHTIVRHNKYGGFRAN